MTSLSLWWNTLRYLRPSQAYCRGRRKALSLVPRSAPFVWDFTPAEYGVPDATAVSEAPEVRPPFTFTFLGRTVNFGDAIRWSDDSLPQLWRFHLHYFEYAGAIRRFEHLAILVRSWIEGNPRIAGDGWHPFTISRRIVNWLEIASRFRPELASDSGFRTLFFGSLYGQARFLASNLEFDVRGNHLFENLRALAIAGLAFEGDEAARWHRDALRLLESELKEQVLDDGGHFERNPGYHVAVLRGILELRAWLEANRRPVPEWLSATARAMHGFLSEILTPGGSLPLLKDTTRDREGLDPSLLERAGLPRPQPVERSAALPASGLYVIRDKSRGDYLIFDAGQPCPAYLPAHAHADALSFELYVSGAPLIVDSGVYEYRAGAWRDYFRSTKAHNTVEVEGQNQSEVWGSFRVARRARVGAVSWSEGAESKSVSAEHDGYTRLRIPVRHRRTIRSSGRGEWRIDDELTGSGNTRAASHIHLHPALTPAEERPGVWRLDGAPRTVRIVAEGFSRTSVTRGQEEPSRQGWYSANFGMLEAGYVITLHREGALPYRFGFTIRADGIG